MAIGNFSANFFREAFFDPAGDSRQALAIVPTDGGLMLRYSVGF